MNQVEVLNYFESILCILIYRSVVELYCISLTQQCNRTLLNGNRTRAVGLGQSRHEANHIGCAHAGGAALALVPGPDFGPGAGAGVASHRCQRTKNILTGLQMMTV